MIRLSVFFLPVFCFLLFSCNGDVSRFQFIYNAETIELEEKPGVETSDEGKLLLVDKQLQSPVYSLKEPVLVEENGTALSLTYAVTEGPLFLSIRSSGETDPEDISLPVNNGKKTEIRVPLEKGAVLSGFQIYSKNSGAAGELFLAGLDASYPGIKFLSDRILQGNSVRLADNTNGLNISFPSGSEGVVELEYYLPDSADNPKIPLTVSNRASGETKIIHLKPSGSGTTLYLYREYLGFVPDRIEITAGNPDFRLVSAAMGKRGTEDVYTPIPADLTTILQFHQPGWRSREFELFAWNAYPEILVFDTADYSVQARMLKRLAFFVEKEGYIGTLRTNEELRGEHGWNAHDYRAEDLADFFNLAEESGFSLNKEELVLKDILLKNEILSREGAKLQAGAGGIISISRESPGYLRRKFIIHEGTHGIFFADEKYRELCFSRWEELSAEGKSFWKLFFAWNNYDTEDRYLMVNEYQAYMLQQGVNKAEHYFRKHGAVKWIQAIGGPVDDGIRFLHETAGVFEKCAQEMDETFHSATGFRAGDLFIIEEIE